MINTKYTRRGYVKLALSCAIDELIKNDYHLIKEDCNERSITHWLAVYLSKFFPTYHVDCEYNRDVSNQKKIKYSSNKNEDTRIIPDIIIHKRGNNSSNLLAIEVKKSASSVNFRHDIEKLENIKKQLGYMYAVHLVIGTDNLGSITKRQEWIP